MTYDNEPPIPWRFWIAVGVALGVVYECMWPHYPTIFAMRSGFIAGSLVAWFLAGAYYSWRSYRSAMVGFLAGMTITAGFGLAKLIAFFLPA